jgi:putative phosphoesterase
MALEEVLKDIERRDIDDIYCLGDSVGYLPYPNEVVYKLREEGIKLILGNHDLAIVEELKLTDDEYLKLSVEEIQAKASRIFTRQTITDENYSFLSNLDPQVEFEVEGFKVLLVHGSPHRIDEYMRADVELLRHVTNGVDADVIVSGHTHVPYHLLVDDKHCINVGSVGKPKHGNSNAVYTILDIDDLGVSTEFIEVKYSLVDILKEIKNNPGINDNLIPALKEGI